jgi:hypothetical protein
VRLAGGIVEKPALAIFLLEGLISGKMEAVPNNKRSYVSALCLEKQRVFGIIVIPRICIFTFQRTKFVFRIS